MGESNRERFQAQIAELCAALKAERTKAGISQRALAAEAHLVQHHLCSIEGGVDDMLLSTFLAILAALDLRLQVWGEDDSHEAEIWSNT